ncbi:DUF4402 domain-containing protein [Alterisphingorhabdus coralli]|uniref:DUF4402 domain-containing protein n=1 Tax=Alterisphingorhabdus coralli TaxID=3071408 RepID=A0AA97F9P1_9SPHN|nr:DUF4402 domain-containing protein [Parasphingorhabdus sp. SCSIO 66989]WOE75055.1 DUF4402 domain-containing protein [Parasphingorhabdus sp. SCSIO 66989]
MGDEDQSGSANQPQIPLRISIEADIRFNRLAFAGAGAGEVQIDPASGSTRTDGGLVDLGGLALTGSARITGEPGRAVRVDLPHSIRLTSQTGGHADLVSLQTSLSPSPRIGPDGTLVFSFAGTLKVSGGIGGHYRGRIPITAEYE